MQYLPFIQRCNARILVTIVCTIMVFVSLELFYAKEVTAAKATGTSINKIQEITVEGQVTDENGEPLIGVNIFIKGTNKGTSTDTNGEYSIEVESTDAVLVFKYIGYATQEVQVEDQTTINVQMQPEGSKLEDIVVVAYGEQKRQTLTGSISSIEGEDLETTTSPSLAQSLQGKVAGVQIRQQNGQPGGFNSKVEIRGMGNPLFVIDGVVRDGGDGAAEFQRLNPEDIEDISVIKDGAAALYGMNAANGAVIVTTKSGQSGPTEFNYKSQATFLTPTNMLEVANAAQHVELKNEMSMNSGTGPAVSEEELENWRSGGPGYKSTDWMDAAFKERAMTTNHTLSAEGGNENITFYTSFGFENQGDLKESENFNYDKYTARSRVTADIAEDLEMDVNISGRYDVTKSPNSGIHNLMFQSTMMEPTDRIYANGNPEYYNVADPFSDNPIAGADVDESGLNKQIGRSLLSSVTFTYSLPWVDGLQAKLKGSYDVRDNETVNENLEYQLYAYDDSNDEIIEARRQNMPNTLWSQRDVNKSQNIQASLEYDTSIKDKHNISLQGLYELDRSRYDYLNGEREFEIYAKPILGLGSEDNIRNDGGYSKSANISYLGRLNYNFKEKYLIEAGFRYNGSYRYAPEKRWGFFPIASIGWRVDQEPFMEEYLEFVSELKLRASYGQTGIDAGDEFQHIPGYTLGGVGYAFEEEEITRGVETPPIRNRDLTWIESRTIDFGVDLELYEGLLGLTVDFYQRNRSGLLATSRTQITNTFGAEMPQENLNEDMTRGIEFVVSHVNSIGDFTYSARGNLNFARSMLTEQVRGEYSSSMDKWRHGQEGRWQGIGWGYETTGRFESWEEIYGETVVQTGDRGNTQVLPGDFYVKDANGDGYITGDDTTPMFYGLNMPALNFGLSIDMTWNNFDLYTLFQGSSAYTLEIPTNLRIAGPWNGNSAAHLYDRWHRKDPFDKSSEWVPGKNPSSREANYNPPANGAQNTDRNTVDGTYLRIKSVEFGYTLPQRFTNLTRISSARIFVNAYNIFTFYDSYLKNEIKVDPEKGEGFDGRMLNYPLSSSVTVGASIDF